MKKAILATLTGCLLLSLVGCVPSTTGGSTATTQAPQPAASPASSTPKPGSTTTTKATSAPAKPAPPEGPAAPGKGSSIADAFYRAVKPRIGENLDYSKGHELLLARAIDTDHKYPEWKMSDVIINHNYQTEERTWAYTFADKSRITFHTMPAGYKEGLKLTSVEIKR